MSQPRLFMDSTNLELQIVFSIQSGNPCLGIHSCETAIAFCKCENTVFHLVESEDVKPADRKDKLYLLEKKSTYKCTCTVQSAIVQKSTVL